MEKAMWMQTLENRSMKSVSLGVDGVLDIDGSNARDIAFVVVDTRGTASDADDRVKVDVTQGGVTRTSFFNLADVWSISFRGYDGDDEFHNTTPCIPSEALGGNGDDLLTGGGRGDTLYGQAGDDRIVSNDGNDSLYGGSGTDVLSGGRGNDRLDGGHDGRIDSLTGGAGADTFVTHGDVGFLWWSSYQRENWSDFNSTEGDGETFVWH
jgi:Ca2+-binding RTX toxin-like protein